MQFTTIKFLVLALVTTYNGLRRGKLNSDNPYPLTMIVLINNVRRGEFFFQSQGYCIVSPLMFSNVALISEKSLCVCVCVSVRYTIIKSSSTLYLIMKISLKIDGFEIVLFIKFVWNMLCSFVRFYRGLVSSFSSLNWLIFNEVIQLQIL